jgi:hypothetical protein
MSTDELLKTASKAPLQIERGVLANKGQIFLVANESGNRFKQSVARLGYAYTKDGSDAREANAELIKRAFNSFEAMREALSTASADIRAVKQAMETPELWDRCETLLGTTEAIIVKALKLAEGVETSTSPVEEKGNFAKQGYDIIDSVVDVLQNRMESSREDINAAIENKFTAEGLYATYIGPMIDDIEEALDLEDGEDESEVQS